MAITRKLIKSLIGGVSQQPDHIRSDNQCEEQLNFLSDPITGLTRRPGTTLIKNITSATTEFSGESKNTFTHLINQSGDDPLLLAINHDTTDTTPEMGLWNLKTGAELTISFEGISDTAYLKMTESGYGDHHPYAAVTISDHTFIVNRDKSTAFTSDTSHNDGHYNKTLTKRGIIFIKEGAYNAEYTIKATDEDGTVRDIRVLTSNGTDTNGNVDSKTDNIAGACLHALTQGTAADVTDLDTGQGLDEASAIDIKVADTEISSGRKFNDTSNSVQIVFTRKGSTIAWYATYTDESAYNSSKIAIEIEDGYGNTMSESFTDKKDLFAGLPVVAPNNYLLKIEGNPESVVDDYYVEFQVNDANLGVNDMGRGKWVESLNEGLSYKIDDTTMPHQLVKVNDTQYKFMKATWEDKSVGDDTTDPAPTFIGKAIQDVFYFKGRLGFLSKESVILSELDNPYNFFRTTTTQTLSTDRIDIESSVNEITLMNYAVPFSNNLILFSDRTQFLLNFGREGLTPSNASLALISKYECSNTARPVVTDNSIMFAQKRANSSAIYELYPTGTTEVSFEAKDVTEQLRTYISGNVVKMESSSLAKSVIIQTDNYDNKLYVYKYFDKGRERVQSAWSRYEFACDYIKAFKFVDDDMYLLEEFKQTGGSTAHYRNFTKTKFDNTEQLGYCLDSAVGASSITIGWDGTAGVTTLTLANSYNIRDHKSRTIVILDSDGVSYTNTKTDSSNYHQLTVGSNLTGKTLTIGFTYQSTYQFSHQYLRRGVSKDMSIPITDGRTIIKWCEAYLGDTHYIKGSVAYPNMNKSGTSKEYNGTFAGGVTMGDMQSENKRMRFMVGSRNNTASITLSSDNHKIAQITGASFEIERTSRLSRLG